MQVQQEAPKFVSEFPLPPSYFKYFKGLTEEIPPPQIPIHVPEQYNGTILPKIEHQFQISSDYRNIFKRYVEYII